MSMTRDQIKQFVEVDHKDEIILVTCDNEHLFYDHLSNNIPILWNWDEETFTVIKTNQEITCQNGGPFEITMVALEEIQFLTAFTNTTKVLTFINENVTDDDQKKLLKEMVQKVRPSTMSPMSLRMDLNGESYVENLKTKK